MAAAVVLCVVLLPILILALPFLAVGAWWGARKRRQLQREFHRRWGAHGKRLLLVYSNSPNWQAYVEKNWLPQLESIAVVLNWSERSTWREQHPFETDIFRRWAGDREFNPLAIVIPADGSVRADAGDRWQDTIPLWAVIEQRRPDLFEETTRSAGQLGDIRVYADALRETAGDVLRGNFGVFASARAILTIQGAQQRIRQHRETRERNRRAAVAAAADACRDRHFRRVVELLSPAERARFDYARARVGRGDSAV